MIKYFYLLIIPALIFFIPACQERESSTMENMSDNLDQYLSSLNNKRIYFGHMSVGANILDGIKELTANKDLQLNIIDKSMSDTLPEGYLLHSDVGENTKPVSKCLDYKSIIQTELKGKIDYALLKFCYIDINENTDISELFSSYKKVLDELILSHPEITFIHVTVPLRKIDKGIGIWVREILGKPNNSKIANIKRNEFNELLKNTYANAPIFDLATYESTHLDGSKEFFTYKNGKKYLSLIANYTDDGGHLNELGRKKIATDFIKYLSEVTNS